MRIGTAMRRSIMPAVGVGAMLGALGALALIAYAAIAGPVGMGGEAVLVVMVGIVLGLIIAGPLAFMFGAVLLTLSSRDRRWFHPAAWALLGLLPGAAAGALVGMGEVEVASVLATGGAALGAIGALLFRAGIRRTLESEGPQFDPDVFA